MNGELLETLLDERSIGKVLSTYPRAVDRLDREALRSIFHPDAIEHHGTFEGLAYDYVDYAIDIALPKYRSTCHYISNSTIDVSGDVARSETYLRAMHLRTDADACQHIDWVGSRLIDRFERRDGVWKIAVRTVVRDWDKTEQITRIEKWKDSFVDGVRGPGDAVYALYADATDLEQPPAGPTRS